jgi:plasmid maintenance system antidote protein VapI
MSKSKPSKKATKTMQPANLVDDLRTEIDSSELSRYEIAKRAEISESVLSHFMSGRRSMTLDTAAKIAIVLGLTLRK